MKTTVFFVSDDVDAINKARAVYETDQKVSLQVYSHQQWNDVLENPLARQNLWSATGQLPQLLSGGGGNVIQFPNSQLGPQIEKIEDMEAKAIETAILQFKGNLTEAARALGIGRATLYRKVKQYKIDPTQARKKRAA